MDIKNILALLLSLSFCFVIPAYSESNEEETSLAKSIIYNGDQLEYLKEKNLVIGKGHVKIEYKDMVLTADEVTVDLNQEKAFAKGQAVLVQDNKKLEAECITYDFKLKQGFVEAANLQFPPWYAYGDEINRQADGSYTVENSYMTTCDKEDPHWRICAKHMQIIPKEKIIAKNVVAYVGKVPVFFWPHYVASLKDKRGKIVFVPGHKSEWGTYLFTGYNYYLNDKNKGTVKLDYRQEKGFAYGLDHEYADDKAKGLFRVYYLDERTGEHPVVEKERYRIKWTHKQDFNDSFWGVIEYHEMSDETILKDYIKKEYERDPQPDTYIYLQQKFEQSNLNLYASTQTNSFFDTIEYQPEIKYHVTNINISDTPLYFTADYSAANINKAWATSGDSTNRLDAYQELGYVEKFGFLTVYPYVGFRETYYSHDKDKDQADRGVVYSGARFQTKFHRTFDVKNKFWDVHGLREVQEPSIAYVHVEDPTVDKDDLIEFDDIDGITDENYFRFQLQSRLQTQRIKDDGSNNWNLILNKIYMDYHPEGLYWDYIDEVKKFSHIVDRLEVSPFTWCRLDLDTRLDPYECRYDEIKADFTLEKKEKGSITFGDHYRRYENSDIFGEVKFNIGSKWRGRIYQGYDFQNKLMLRQEYTIYRNFHCITGAFTYSRQEDEQTTEHEYWLTFYLNAFAKDVFDITEGLHGGVN